MQYEALCRQEHSLGGPIFAASLTGLGTNWGLV